MCMPIVYQICDCPCRSFFVYIPDMIRYGMRADMEQLCDIIHLISFDHQTEHVCFPERQGRVKFGLANNPGKWAFISYRTFYFLKMESSPHIYIRVVCVIFAEITPDKTRNDPILIIDSVLFLNITGSTLPMLWYKKSPDGR